MTPPVVIVGAGHAGGRLAERLRHFGWQHGIVLVGEEPTLPYERPPLSKAFLTQPDEPPPSLVIGPDGLRAMAITHIGGVRAEELDLRARRVSLTDGSHLGYSALVLATGLIPRRVPELARIAGRVTTLRSLEQARDLRARLRPGTRLLIVGAGFVGLEVAASARARGAEVTVVELAPRPLARAVPPLISDWLCRLHQDSGIQMRLGRRIVAAKETGGEPRVTLDSGETIAADLILAGVGSEPDDRLARAAGLDVGNGIAVDENCRTSAADVYAIGDVACHLNPIFDRRWRLESWKNAEDTAAVAAQAICGQPVPYSEVPWFWTDQYGRNLQIAGVPEDGSQAYVSGETGAPGYLVYFLASGRLRGAIGIDCGRAIRKARDLIRKATLLEARDLADLGFRPLDGQRLAHAGTAG